MKPIASGLLLLILLALTPSLSATETQSLSTAAGLSGRSVRSVFRDNNHLMWLGTENGLDRYDGQVVTPFSKRFSTPVTGAVQSVSEIADGELLIGTTSGAYLYQLRKNLVWPIDFGRKSLDVRCVRKMPDGRILLATEKGLFTLNREKLKTDIVLCCNGCQPAFNDILWVNPTVIRLAGEDGVYEFSSTKQGHLLRRIFKSVPVKCLHQLGTTLYIGTSNGLLVSRGTTFHASIVKGAGGIPVLSLASDSAGALYIGTDQAGLFCIGQNASAAKPILTGLPALKTVASLFCDETNTLWCGTINDGVVACFLNFLNEGESRNPFHPVIHLAEIRINGTRFDADTMPTVEKVDSNGYRVSITGLKNNKVSLRLAALNYRFSGKNQYSFMLEGVDKTWSSASLNPVYNCPDLSPGTYTLLVKACNNDKVWTSDPARISLVLVPHLWESWWFVSLTILLISLTLYWLIKRYRLRSKTR